MTIAIKAIVICPLGTVKKASAFGIAVRRCHDVLHH